MSDNTFSTLDEQVFAAEAWHPMGGLNAQFKDVTLNVQVGDFAAGTKFPYAVLVGDSSILVLVDEQKQEHGFRLNVSVGEKVEPPQVGHDDESCDCGHEHH